VILKGKESISETQEGLSEPVSVRLADLGMPHSISLYLPQLLMAQKKRLRTTVLHAHD